VLDQVEYLAMQMSQRRMPLKGVVMNRVHALFASEALDDESPESIAATTEEPARPAFAHLPPGSDGRDLLLRLARNFCAHQSRARGDAVRVEVFRQGLPSGVPLVQVPNLARDIHDLRGLSALHPFLFRAA
jgi:hypothetical protein